MDAPVAGGRRWQVILKGILLAAVLAGFLFLAPSVLLADDVTDEVVDGHNVQVQRDTPTELVLAITFQEPVTSAVDLIVVPWTGWPRVEVVDREFMPLPSTLPASAVASSPQAQVTLEPVGSLRGVRLARLVARPAYQDRAGRVQWTSRLVVRVRFPGSVRPRPAAPPEPDVVAALRQEVLNPNALTWWRRPRQQAAPPAPEHPPAHDPTALRLRTQAPGMYVVTRDAVAQAGWDVEAIDPRYVQLWVDGKEVPVWFLGQQDGRWDPEDELRFYAPPFHSRYTDERVWWLVVGDRPGKRWRARPTLPPVAPETDTVQATLTTEVNALYDSRFQDTNGEPWFWFDLKFLDFAPYPALDFVFRVAEPAPFAMATVTLDLYAYKGVRHDMAFAVNGVPSGELHASWVGPRSVILPVPDSVIRSGWNRLTIVSTDKGEVPDGVYMDRISVTYRRQLRAPDGVLTFRGEPGVTYRVQVPVSGYVAVLDVTDPLDPVLIYGTYAYETVEGGERVIRFRVDEGGLEYHVTARSTWQRPRIERNVPSNLHTPEEGADVLVIAPRAWQDALSPWVAWRTAQGFRVRVVAIQDIYDEFSYGQPTPEAIRRFIRHAYAQWPDPAPRYVVLVGDGSYDFKNYSGFDPPTVIPPYMARVDPWLGETASDLRYVEVDGEDEIPDLFIGRWPVRTEAEVQTVVAKVLFYERDMPTAEWQRRIVFIADNYRDAAGRPDGAGDFVAEAERTLQGQLRLPFVGERVYYMPWLDTTSANLYDGFTRVEDMRAYIRALWNEGRGIINWIGHASYEQWGAENFLHARELADLRNAERLPFLFSISCFTGFFQHPEYASLDEALLLKPDGGVIATWSPTGLAVAYGHRYLQEGFYQALMAGERRLGPLTLAGTLRVLSGARTYWFLPQTYVILGDPLLTLRTGPTEESVFLPLVIQ